MMRNILGVVAAGLCTILWLGCTNIETFPVGRSGTDTIRIVTVPAEAKVYVNGEMKGLSPVSIPQKWENAGSKGETLEISIQKDGYAAVETTITYEDTVERFWREEFKRGSEFGRGDTYTYTFRLKR